MTHAIMTMDISTRGEAPNRLPLYLLSIHFPLKKLNRSAGETQLERALRVMRHASCIPQPVRPRQLSILSHQAGFDSSRHVLINLPLCKVNHSFRLILSLIKQ